MAARRKIVGTAALTVTAALVLTACKSSSEPVLVPVTSTTSSTAVSAPASTATTGGTGPSLPADLDDVVLKVTDMPTGWTPTTNPAALLIGQAGCLTPASGRASTKYARYVAFASAGGTPIFAESLAYVGAAAAPKTYAAGVKAMNACHTIKFAVGKVTLTGSVQPTSFPVVGAHSQAYTLTATSGTYVLTEYILIAQEPGVVLMTSYGSLKNGLITDFLSLTSKASSKLTS